MWCESSSRFPLTCMFGNPQNQKEGGARPLKTANPRLLQPPPEEKKKALAFFWTQSPHPPPPSPLKALHPHLSESARREMAVAHNQWYHVGVGEFTTHSRLPILVVGLSRMLGANRFGFWILPMATWPWVKTPYPQVNIPIPTKIGSLNWVVHSPIPTKMGSDPKRVWPPPPNGSCLRFAEVSQYLTKEEQDAELRVPQSGYKAENGSNSDTSEGFGMCFGSPGFF